MAKSKSDKHGSSEINNNRHCEICHDLKHCDLEAVAYCSTCTNFLCDDCTRFHEKWMKYHELLIGDEIPISIDDRIPKYKSCKNHVDHQNNLFCFEHKTMACSKCYEEFHDKCIVRPISEIAETIDKAEMDKLKDAVNLLKTDIDCYRSLLSDNIISIETQRSNMLKEAQTIHGSLIAKVNYLYYEIKGEIFKVCKEKSTFLSNQKAKLDTILSKLDGCLNVIEQMKIKDTNESTFIGIQDVVSQSRLFASCLVELQRSSNRIELSLKPSHDTLELLDSSLCFGAVDVAKNKYNIAKPVPDISFPLALPSTPTRSIPTTPTTPRLSVAPSLEKIEEEGDEETQVPEPENNSKTYLRKNVNVQMEFDTKGCLINDMTVTGNGKKILTDVNNQKVKLFALNMKFLSSFSLLSAPRGITSIGNNEIVVSTKDKSLTFMDISENMLTVTRKLKMRHSIFSVAVCGDNLYLSRGTNPPSVKKVDKTGKGCWTVNKDKQGHKLFKSACHLTGSVRSEDTRIFATDSDAETVTVLDGETGNILAVRHLKGKGPKSLTADSDGNIYICYSKTHEICMMSRNLSEDKILLSTIEGLSPEPLAIAFDRNSEQIMVSNNLYFQRDTVAIFQKTFYI